MTCFDLRRELQSKEDELEDARAAANKKLKILEQQLEQVTHKNNCSQCTVPDP
jgi:prefoldin subunit 5